MIQKKLITNFISDFSGQGTIRNIWPFSVINSVYGKNYSLINFWHYHFVTDDFILSQTKTAYFQRTHRPEQMPSVLEIKRLQGIHGFKMVLDHDDLLWGKNELYEGGNEQEGVTSYNNVWKYFDENVQKTATDIMNCMDTLLFSTQYLADYAKNILNVNPPCLVIPNTVPRAYWGQSHRFNKLNTEKEKIEKPIVLYAASPSHYNNTTKNKGDWSDEWIKWVIKSVNEERIELVLIGGLPFFFECIKEKAKTYPFVPIFHLHNIIMDNQPHFSINPLKINNFNRAKSDLKLVEASAGKIACIGTVFSDGSPSPFDGIYDKCKVNENVTVEEIDEMFDVMTNHNEWLSCIKHQDEFMERESRFTEDPKNIDRLLKAIL